MSAMMTTEDEKDDSVQHFPASNQNLTDSPEACRDDTTRLDCSESSATKTSSSEEALAASVSMQSKVAAAVLSAILMAAIILGIFIVITSPDRDECRVCSTVDVETFVTPSFFWYSSWCLVLTSVTWGVFVKRYYFSASPSPSSSDEDGEVPLRAPVLPRSFSVSLPLSLTVCIGYTFYIATSNWGRDFLDPDVCIVLPLLGDGIQKETYTRTEEVLYLLCTGFVNVTMHYICTAINLGLYFQFAKRSGVWRPFWPMAVLILESICLILVHEQVTAVYCTANIFHSCFLIVAIFTVLHCAFFCRRIPFQKCRKSLSTIAKSCSK